MRHAAKWALLVTAMQASSGRIAVLGGGLQGACIALELARRGAKIDLYERNHICVAEASAHNEGKVHLGFVYAFDRSFATSRLMATGALCFQRLLRQWLGDDVESLVTSAPFAYAVHRTGLMKPDAFECHAKKVSAFIADSVQSEVDSYFGSSLCRAPERLSAADFAAAYRADTVAAVFRTAEIAINPESLARLVRLRLGVEPAISCLTNRKVLALYDSPQHVTVVSSQNGTSDEAGYDYVVNSLWTDRLRIDSLLGLNPVSPWCFRFKYFVRATARQAHSVPSTTVVLGPFGDIVSYADGSVYLSWYPSGLAAWSRDVAPPELPSTLDGQQAVTMKQRIIDGLSTVVPGVAELELSDVMVQGGWIFASGNSDIDNPTSGLHRRSSVGVHRRGRYLSVNTGKLTLAPLFAEQTALMLD